MVMMSSEKFLEGAKTPRIFFSAAMGSKSWLGAFACFALWLFVHRRGPGVGDFLFFLPALDSRYLHGRFSSGWAAPSFLALFLGCLYLWFVVLRIPKLGEELAEAGSKDRTNQFLGVSWSKMFSPYDCYQSKTFRVVDLQAWPTEAELKPPPVETPEIPPKPPTAPTTDAAAATPAPAKAMSASAAVPMSEAEVAAMPMQLSAEAI